MPSTNKEINNLIKEIKKQGWRVDEGYGKSTSHIKCYPPERDKPMVTLSTSTSTFSAIKSMRSDLRRSGAIL